MFFYFQRDELHSFVYSNMLKHVKKRNQTKLESQVAGQSEEITRSADRQDRQKPKTRKYQLHNAFRELGDGSLETIESMLAQGADVDEKDESGLTILQYILENP